jgi:hypothetical protein
MYYYIPGLRPGAWPEIVGSGVRVSDQCSVTRFSAPQTQNASIRKRPL